MVVNKEHIINILRSTYFYGAIFATVVFIKCVLFNRFAFDQVVVSSLWKAPAAFWGFYLPKIAMAIGVASFVLLCNRKWVAIVLSVFIDIWIIANLMYVRSYGMVIDAFSITMVGNLSGFESSLPLYLRWEDIVYPLLTLPLFLLPYSMHRGGRRGLVVCVYILFAIIVGYMGQYSYLRARSNRSETISDFRWRLFTRGARQTMYGMELTYPTQQTSILHTIGYDISDLLEYLYEKWHPYHLSNEDKAMISKFYRADAEDAEESLPGPLVIVVVESFEDWVFQPQIMPHLTAFCETHPVLYTDKVKSQVRGGMSADGQMLINTGVLPTLEGAACFRFPRNTYPGVMQYIEGKSAMLVPHNVDVWNQQMMSAAYGYDTTAQVSPVDTILFRQVLEYIHIGYKNVQLLTMSTHTPFTSGAALSDLEIEDDKPALKRDYMKAFNAFDYGLNVLLEAIDMDAALQNATVVITGDHNILSKNASCPLIIYSPKFERSITYTEECYQMDVYPTLVDVLGIDPCWQGFGISLLMGGERKITEEQAYDLSDKMHRANYFAHVDDNIPHYIAHAGGMIEGYTYTNSLEAVNNAIANDIRYIELDFDFTNDDLLVATHDWMGCEDIMVDGKNPSYADFMKHRRYSRFTPIDYTRIDSIMQTNPKLHLVTDKISDYEIITKYFGKYKNRLIVECFKDEDYYRLKEAGYEVFRSEYPPTKKGVIKHILKFNFHDWYINEYVFEGVGRSSFKALHGDAFAVYTCPDRQSADAIFEKDDRIKYIYIDDVNQ